MDRIPMKEARICLGVCVDGSGFFARVMIRADHTVCSRCIGSGKNYDIDEICPVCDGGGTVPETPTNNIEE